MNTHRRPGLQAGIKPRLALQRTSSGCIFRKPAASSRVRVFMGSGGKQGELFDGPSLVARRRRGIDDSEPRIIENAGGSQGGICDEPPKANALGTDVRVSTGHLFTKAFSELRRKRRRYLARRTFPGGLSPTRRTNAEMYVVCCSSHSRRPVGLPIGCPTICLISSRNS